MKRAMKKLAIWVVLLSPAVALAHPGHGVLPGNSLWHWLCEPLHAAPLAVGALVAVAALRKLLAARPR